MSHHSLKKIKIHVTSTSFWNDIFTWLQITGHKLCFLAETYIYIYGKKLFSNDINMIYMVRNCFLKKMI